MQKRTERRLTPSVVELKEKRRNAPQWPTFPPPQNGSIIGAVLFHCQVRDGTGWDQYAQITEQIFSALAKMNSNLGSRLTLRARGQPVVTKNKNGVTHQTHRHRPVIIMTTSRFQNVLALYLKSASQLLSLSIRLGTSNEEKGEAKFKIGGDKRSTMRHNLALPLLGKHSCAHNLVIFQGSYLLSFEEVGRLIWRGVSRLDAFSSSPFPT
jgi:hypothetical protein